VTLSIFGTPTYLELAFADWSSLYPGYDSVFAAEQAGEGRALDNWLCFLDARREEAAVDAPDLPEPEDRARLIRLLRERPHDPDDLAARMGYHRSTVNPTLDFLARNGEVVQVARAGPGWKVGAWVHHTATEFLPDELDLAAGWGLPPKPFNLGIEKRRQLIEILQDGPATYLEIHERMPEPRPTTASLRNGLTKLRQHGLIAKRRGGVQVDRNAPPWLWFIPEDE
jgi:hypothetical protein